MEFFENLKYTLMLNQMKSAFNSSRLGGIPSKLARTSSNFRVSGALKRYNRDYNIYKVSTFRDNLKIEWRLLYLLHNKEEKIWLEANMQNLDLSYSADGMKLMKEKYGDTFSISFNKGYTYIYFKTKQIPSGVKTVKEYIKYCESVWNDTGFYKLLKDIKNL